MPDSTTTILAAPPAAPSSEFAPALRAGQCMPMAAEREGELLQWLYRGGSLTPAQALELGAELVRLRAVERGVRKEMQALARETLASVWDGAEPRA